MAGESIYSPSIKEVLCVLSLPHILFVYIWFAPKHFQRLVKPRDAVAVFAAVAWLLKVIQFTTVYLWYISLGAIDLTSVRPQQWAVWALLFFPGQALNLGIYSAIGSNGVYYGFKLGKKVPWVKGFPFNVVRHPQYVGTVMSIWALMALMYDEKHQDVPLVGGVWSLYYFLSAMMEEYP